MPSVKAGSYIARVRAVNASGIGSVPTVSSATAVADQTMQPTTLTTLQTEVATAQSGATAANAELANIASDGIVSAAEKPTVIRDYSVITAEQAGIDAQAVSFLGASSSQQIAYDNAISSLTTYLGGLTTPKAWNDKTGDTTVVGATFRSNFNTVYTTRQTLLNAIYAQAQSLANNAQGTANTANATANNAAPATIINPFFANALSGWQPDTPNAGWYQSTGVSSPIPNVNTYAVHAGSTITAQNPGAVSGTSLYNLGFAPMAPGQILSAACPIYPIGTPDGGAHVRINWLNSSMASVGISYGNGITAGIGRGTSRVSATAPAGTVGARVEVDVYSHTVGYYTFSGASWSYQPSNVGEVPDGGGRYAVHQVDPNNLAIIDFTQAGHVSKNLDNISPGAIYTAALKSGTSETVDNPDFEASATIIDPPGWVNTGGCTLGYTAAAYSGNQALVMTATATFAACASVRNYACVPGQQYLLQGACANNSGATPSASIYLQAFDKSGSSIGFYGASNTTASGSGYLLLSNVVTIPALAVTFRIILIMQPPSSSGYSSFFDMIRLVLVRNMDTMVGDGTIYGRTAQSDLYSSGGVNRVGLRVAGSGHVMGNQLNAPNSLTLNYGASRTATAVTATSAGAVSINVFTFKMGGASVTYSAVSNAVNGLTIGTTYQIYCHDSGGTGGTKTWSAVAGTQLDALSIADDVVIAGQVTIPSSGSSGGGGTGCPDENAWVLRADPDGVRDDWCVQAKTIIAGLHYLRLTDGRIGLATYSERKASPRVRVVTTDGDRSLTCSTSAPLELFRGSGKCVLAPESAAHWISTRFQGWAGAALIDRAEDAGPGFVQHITCQNACFWAGDDPDYLFGHHNLKP